MSFKYLSDSKTFYITYPAGRVAISNKMLFHSLRLNCQIRAVPSRLPLTNLTKGEKSYSEIKGRSVQKGHLKNDAPELRTQKRKLQVRSSNSVRMQYNRFEVKNTSRTSKKLKSWKKQNLLPYPEPLPN